MSDEIRFNISDLENGIAHLGERLSTATLMFGTTKATELETYMKENRKWTDRTGDARGRLAGRAYKSNTGIRIELSHGVNYGLWLELAHEKKYAIIEPTVRLKSREVMEDFQDLLSRLR